jgi:hypothetical protein
VRPSFILLKLNLALRLKKVEAPARAPEFYFIKIKSCSETEKSRGSGPSFILLKLNLALREKKIEPSHQMRDFLYLSTTT